MVGLNALSLIVVGDMEGHGLVYLGMEVPYV